MLRLADCFLTEMADKRAETGSLSDADPICYRPNKYDSLQIHIKAWLLTYVAENELFES